MNEERKPPEKVRVTNLQEAQLASLEQIEARYADQLGGVGVAVKPRTEMQIARLTKDHDVLVAEADHEVAGYLVWADQAPGVAWMPTLIVAPEYQRFGLGTHLLRELGEVASNSPNKIGAVATPVWERAIWSLGFLATRGFKLLEPGASGIPEKLGTWSKDHATSLVEAGQKLWWAPTDGLGTVPGLPRPPASAR